MGTRAEDICFVELGRRYRDTETGFVGVATAIATYRVEADEVRLETLSQQGAVLCEWMELTRVVLADD